VLRGIASGEVPIGTPQGPPLNMLAHALALYIIQRLLSTRAAVRAATALSLRLLPLALSPDGSALPPYPEGALRRYLDKSPTAADRFPVHPTFLALPPSPLSLPLCSALMRSGMGNLRFKVGESVPKVRWQRMHSYLAIGLDPNCLTESPFPTPQHTDNSASPSPLGTCTNPMSAAATCAPQPQASPFKTARMCALLICCAASSSSSVRAITLIEPVPTHVFSHAQQLINDGVKGSEVLATVGAHGSTEQLGWFTKALPDKPCGLSGRKRTRLDTEDSASLATDAQRAVNEVDAVPKRSRVQHEANSDVFGSTTNPTAEQSSKDACPTNRLQNHEKMQHNAAVPTRSGAPHAHRHDACGGGSEWGSEHVARERMEVALMVGWLQLRALTAYLTEELRGMNADFTEHSASSGSVNPCIPGVPNPRIIIKAMWVSKTEMFNFHAAEFVPWPRCVPRLLGEKVLEGTVADAAVRSVHIIVTGASTWELHIQSSLLAAAFTALNCNAHSRNSTVRTNSSVGTRQRGAKSSQHQQKQRLWQWSPDKPDMIVAGYSTLRRMTATYCWQHILSAMSAMQKLNGFAVLQNDLCNSKHAAQGGVHGVHEGQNTNDQTADFSKSTGVAPIVYNFDVFEVTVLLVSLDTIRVSVSKTKDITFSAVSSQVDVPAASFAAFAPTAVPAQPPVPIIELEITHHLENRVEVTHADSPVAAPPKHSLILPMLCRCVPDRLVIEL
jgi:hypothetical protein